MPREFDARCYELLERIPKGRVTTYKEMARALGTKAYRAVGNAMGRNPDLITVPCHRVVKSDGSLGGYALGVDKKIQLLTNEGVVIKNGKVKHFKTLLYRFDGD